MVCCIRDLCLSHSSRLKAVGLALLSHHLCQALFPSFLFAVPDPSFAPVESSPFYSFNPCDDTILLNHDSKHCITKAYRGWRYTPRVGCVRIGPVRSDMWCSMAQSCIASQLRHSCWTEKFGHGARYPSIHVNVCKATSPWHMSVWRSKSMQ